MLAIGGGALAWRQFAIWEDDRRWIAAAKVAESQGDWRAAAAHWERHHAIRPRDHEGTLRFAYALAHTHGASEDRARAIELLGEVVDQDPTQTTARARLAELLLETDPRGAIEAADKALQVSANDPHLLCVRAMAYDRIAVSDPESGVSNEVVADLLQKALDKAPDRFDVAERLLQRQWTLAGDIRGRDPTLADAHLKRVNQILDDLVSQHPQKAKPRLLRRAFHTAISDSEATGPELRQEDLRIALASEPMNAEVRLAWIEQSMGSVWQGLLWDRRRPSNDLSAEQTAELETHLKIALNLTPLDPRLHLANAELSWLNGDVAGAVDRLTDGLETTSGNDLVRMRLIEALIAQQEFTGAKRHLDRLLESAVGTSEKKPHNPRLAVAAQVVLARWLAAAQNTEMAVATLERADAMARLPGQEPDLRLLVGRTFTELRDWDHADTILRAVERQHPRLAEARLARAELSTLQGRHHEAIQQYDTLLSLSGGALTSEQRQQAAYEAVRSELGQQLAVPVDQRGWAMFETRYRLAEDLGTDACALTFLKAESLLLHSEPLDFEAARRFLSEAEEAWGESPRFWRLAFDMYVRHKNIHQAELALARVNRLSVTRPVALQERLERLRANGLSEDNGVTNQAGQTDGTGSPSGSP